MNNKVSLTITVSLAALAVIAVVFTVVMLVSKSESPPVDDGLFVVDDSLRAEAQQAAKQLLINNFEVFSLFYTMPFERELHFEPEPYGHESPDGYYTLRQGVLEHDTIESIFALIDATYIETAADSVKNNTDRTGGSGSVYIAREGLGRIGIGVNGQFTPVTADISGDVEIELEFESDERVLLNVLPVGEDESRGVRVFMLRGDEGWRLENIVPVA